MANINKSMIMYYSNLLGSTTRILMLIPEYYDQCNDHNHLAMDCMLRKTEENKEKVKDEAYYAKLLEKVHAKTKNLLLMANRGDDSDETYQICHMDLMI